MAVDVSGLFNTSAEPSMAQATEGQPGQATTPVEAPKDPYSEAFLKIARKEKDVRQREKGIGQYKTRAEQLELELNGYKQIKEDPKANVRKLLDTYGLTYEDINDYILNESDLTLPNEYKELQSEVKSLKQSLEDKEKAQEQQNQQAVIDGFKRDITSQVESGGFEFIKANDAIDSVWEVIREYYNETEKSTGKGEVLETARACEFVEKGLEEEFEKRFGNLSKVKNRFQAKIEPLNPTQPRETLTSYTYGESNTLSNRLNASSPVVPNNRPLSREESLAQAAKMLRFV